MKLLPLVVVCVAAVQTVAQVPTSKPVSRPAPPGADRPAEAFPFFARVVKNDVNVRGGPSDAYSPVSRLKAGALVRVVGRADDWFKIEVPGGLALWAAMKTGDRTFIKEEAPGLGVVVARDLQIRGTPSTNEPPLGELNPGDKVEIIGMKDEWANILMPAKHSGYVAARMAKAVPDAAAAAAEFIDLDSKAREERRGQSAALVSTLKKRDVEAGRAKRAETAFDRYASERRKPAAERDTNGLREALEAVAADGGPENEAHAARAKSLLEDLKSSEDLEHQLVKARAAQAEAEKRSKESQLTYEKDLEALKRRKEEEAAQNERRGKKYVAVGFVRLAPPIPGEVANAPKYALQRGSQREYYLVSDKYQLSDYSGKHIGILEADPPEERPGATIRVLRVKKIEIISPGAE